MSQTLMPTERDIGAMISYEPLRRSAKNKFIKLDAGLFNGQGLSGITDFDSHKDFISRLTVKPIPLHKFSTKRRPVFALWWMAAGLKVCVRNGNIEWR